MKKAVGFLLIAVLFAGLSVFVNFVKFGGSEKTECEPISKEEKAFIEDIEPYDTSRKILGLINQEFEIVNRNDNVLLPAIETYNAKEGTEYDLFRLVFNILLKNGYQGVIFVYEYDSNIGVVLNFRDKEKPRYYYFNEGVLKMEHHGWSFSDLLLKEEQRKDVEIDRFGIMFEGDLLGGDNLDITDVCEWELREKWIE